MSPLGFLAAFLSVCGVAVHFALRLRALAADVEYLEEGLRRVGREQAVLEDLTKRLALQHEDLTRQLIRRTAGKGLVN